jgi:hypothetical protein
MDDPALFDPESAHGSEGGVSARSAGLGLDLRI